MRRWSHATTVTSDIKLNSEQNQSHRGGSKRKQFHLYDLYRAVTDYKQTHKNCHMESKKNKQYAQQSPEHSQSSDTLFIFSDGNTCHDDASVDCKKRLVQTTYG